MATDGNPYYETMTLLNGNVGIGLTSPLSRLHIKAGSAVANTAPIQLTAGPVEITPRAGCIEFDGTDYWLTT